MLIRIAWRPEFVPVVPKEVSLGRRMHEVCPDEVACVTDRLLWACRRGRGVVGPIPYEARFRTGGGYRRQLWGALVGTRGRVLAAVRTLGALTPLLLLLDTVPL